MLHETAQKRASWRLRIAIMPVAALAVAAYGIFGRVRHEKELERIVMAHETIPVEVFTPELGPSEQSLTLAGNVAPNIEAQIYSRVGGYLKNWYTDIGTRVKESQLLAKIETPELDQQILRAEADLATAKANMELASNTAKRWRGLLSSHSVSRQEVDEKIGDQKAKRSIANSLKANLLALRAQQLFNQITAPFDGVVTERNTDIGMLINVGSSASVKPLFKVADTSKLRVYVEVPQSYSARIGAGTVGEVKFPELPSRTFIASFVGTSGAVHENTRTLTVELMLDNAKGELMPGTYAEVCFKFPSAGNVYRLPASALLFRKNGLEVATAGADGTVVLKHIEVGNDLGGFMEVVSGLDGADLIIDSPSDSLMQGDKIRIVKHSPPNVVKTGTAQ